MVKAIYALNYAACVDPQNGNKWETSGTVLITILMTPKGLSYANYPFPVLWLVRSYRATDYRSIFLQSLDWLVDLDISRYNDCLSHV